MRMPDGWTGKEAKMDGYEFLFSGHYGEIGEAMGRLREAGIRLEDLDVREQAKGWWTVYVRCDRSREAHEALGLVRHFC